VHLKKGAQVIIVKNINSNLVNSSLRKVLSFITDKIFKLYIKAKDTFFTDDVLGQASLSLGSSTIDTHNLSPT